MKEQRCMLRHHHRSGRSFKRLIYIASTPIFLYESQKIVTICFGLGDSYRLRGAGSKMYIEFSIDLPNPWVFQAITRSLISELFIHNNYRACSKPPQWKYQRVYKAQKDTLIFQVNVNPKLTTPTPMVRSGRSWVVTPAPPFSKKPLRIGNTYMKVFQKGDRVGIINPMSTLYLGFTPPAMRSLHYHQDDDWRIFSRIFLKF